jgi:hypothetical protein
MIGRCSILGTIGVIALSLAACSSGEKVESTGTTSTTRRMAAGPLYVENQGNLWVSRDDVSGSEESTDMTLSLENRSSMPVAVSHISSYGRGVDVLGIYLADGKTTTPGIAPGFPPHNGDGSVVHVVAPDRYGSIKPGESALVALRLRRKSKPAGVLSGVRIAYSAGTETYDEDFASFALLCATKESSAGCKQAIKKAQEEWWKTHDRPS